MWVSRAPPEIVPFTSCLEDGLNLEPARQDIARLGPKAGVAVTWAVQEPCRPSCASRAPCTQERAAHNLPHPNRRSWGQGPREVNCFCAEVFFHHPPRYGRGLPHRMQRFGSPRCDPAGRRCNCSCHFSV